MYRDQRIALIATGDELTQGEISNTDGQAIAQELTALGYCVGTHMVVTDLEQDILLALQFLQTHYATIIVTGGLGPTNDDRTRHAVAALMKQPLTFDEQVWSAIEKRFQALNKPIHECNRRQALFPAGATVFANPHGTAPGFKTLGQDCDIFVLPGPPKECMPMFTDEVLPRLNKNTQLCRCCQFSWRLTGASESVIAPQLEALIDNPEYETGYRAHKPYLDVKLRTPVDADSKALRDRIEALLAPYLVDNEQQ